MSSLGNVLQGTKFKIQNSKFKAIIYYFNLMVDLSSIGDKVTLPRGKRSHP